MPTEEEINTAKHLVEADKKERENQFVTEFNALKERYPNIEISFVIQNEQDLMTKLFTEIRNAGKAMKIEAK